MKVHSGSFPIDVREVFKALNKLTNEMVALKRVIFPYEQQKDEETRKKYETDGFPVISLREIKILKHLEHENIIRLLDIAVQRGNILCFLFFFLIYAIVDNRQRSKIFYVFPYMDSDLAGLIENNVLTEPLIKCFMIQLLNGLSYLRLVILFMILE